MKSVCQFMLIIFLGSMHLVFTNAIANDVLPNAQVKLLNVVTIQTDSVMGNEIARAFSQLLFTRQLTVNSSLNIREIVQSNSTREILLETPLRRITAHTFTKSQPRRWSNPVNVAEHFLSVAQREGILVSSRLK